MVFNESGAAFHPVAIIHIGDSVNPAHFCHMDMAADCAIKALTTAIVCDVQFEIMNVIERPLGPFFERLRKRPIWQVEPGANV